MSIDWRGNLSDPRTLLLLAALGFTLLAIALPPFATTRDGVDVLAVIDITGSMNVRDYTSDGKPTSRLTVAKAALKDMIEALPCPSRLGLALFAERVPFLLFEPIDVCKDYGAVAGAIDSIDWREGWEGDSHIATAFYRAFDMAKDLDSDLVFITDGQESPPLPLGGAPAFDGKAGSVKGLVVGAGGYALSPIPKFDDRGQEVGFWSVDEVPHESRFGPPPVDAESRPGYEARNAPFGAIAPTGNEHLSSVREPYLRMLAEKTGLRYVHMNGPSGLAEPLVAVAAPQQGGRRSPLHPRRGGSGGSDRSLRRSAGSRPPSVRAPASAGRRVSMMRRFPILLGLGIGLVGIASSEAHGPTPQKVDETIVIRADPKAVWAVAGDFAGIAKWDSELSSSSGGTRKRVMTFKTGGTLEEDVDEYDAARMTYTYRMSEPDVKAIPASSYSATLIVTPKDGGSQIEWYSRVYRGDTGNEPPDALNDQAAKDSLSKFFKAGIQGIKAKVEGKS